MNTSYTLKVRDVNTEIDHPVLFNGSYNTLNEALQKLATLQRELCDDTVDNFAERECSTFANRSIRELDWSIIRTNRMVAFGSIQLILDR